MAVTIKEVEDIAALAKLRFNEGQKIKLQKELNTILDYIEQLNELDLNDTEPVENINPTENVWREDKVKESISPEEALANAPSKTHTYFKVPKVLDK